MVDESYKTILSPRNRLDAISDKFDWFRRLLGITTRRERILIVLMYSWSKERPEVTVRISG